MERNMKKANQISLRQLRCFVTVADELHFRRAAEKLHMRQPPLTQRIRDMERDLGVELFRRIGNKVELTDAGKTRSLEIVGTVNRTEFGSIVCASSSDAIRLDVPASAKTNTMTIFISRMPFSTFFSRKLSMRPG